MEKTLHGLFMFVSDEQRLIETFFFGVAAEELPKPKIRSNTVTITGIGLKNAKITDERWVSRLVHRRTYSPAPLIPMPRRRRQST